MYSALSEVDNNQSFQRTQNQTMHSSTTLENLKTKKKATEIMWVNHKNLVLFVYKLPNIDLGKLLQK